ncbi:hypothetical protein [uncultured Tateyamaria sp.]|uniref:hypothetical protein n=1 Tax=uncultured Tateyamaria sp. TaxID=455651 RepID=UPI00263587BB|nr:hypothetical protein [uncultured Tateyamaria sp.]
MSAAWHILRDGEGVTLCRHLPPRFDVAAHTTLKAGHPIRLAHQIRQDMWRALQKVRGFSPVVELRPTEAGWAVTAGGRISGTASARDVRRIHDTLANPENRTRWMRHAGGTG